ncbi:MAG: DEAD/DEAH box helicase [Bacteroidota bacterium]
MTFKETELNSEILKALDELGFVNPTPIQEKTIPHLLSDERDLVGFAQTGTGKTAAFGLPIIHQIDTKSKNVQAIILSPTRELCVQIAKDITNYSKYTKGLSVVAVYGGTSIDTQIRSLNKGAQIVVGTPGRTLDLIKRKKLKLSSVDYLVLDEADEMLTMGFKDDLDAILEGTPEEKQTLLFSATMPKEIANIAKKYMNNAVEISAGKKNTGAANVNHVYYMVNARDRYLALKRIADINPQIYGIVFCRTRRETKEVAEKLMADGYNADALHGDLSQAQRDYVMNRFRVKNLQLLVATDVAARGLDVNELTHIINYNLPDDLEVYIHRSGRTGRAGKKGVSISIIHSREKGKIRMIQKKVGKTFEHAPVPSGKEICGKQLYNLIDKVEKIEVDNSQIEQFLPEIYKKLEWLSREELIQHFVSAEFNRFLAYYKNAPDLNVSSKSDRGDRSERSSRSRSERSSNRSDRSDRGRASRDGNFSRFFINLGTNHDLSTVKLIGIINDNTRSKDIEIGKIDLMKKFSFFEIEKKHEEKILKSFENKKHDGLRISVELAQSKGESTGKSREKTRKKFNDKKSENWSKKRKRK